jgi:hypothetical protein
MSKRDAMDRRGRNLSQMLERLGLDTAALAHGRLATGLRSAVVTCQSCDVDQLCEAWLLRAPEWLDAAPAFCPNAELFACERDVVYGGIRGCEQAAPDPDILRKVLDDLCGRFGRSERLARPPTARCPI